MWPDFVEAIANRFTHENYLVWSRALGALWTVADVIIAYCIIRLGNIVRTHDGVRLHRLSYAVLAATCVPAAFIPFIKSGASFFHLELMATVPQYLIILYVCALDAGVGIRALSNALDSDAETLGTGRGSGPADSVDPLNGDHPAT